ncbi:MAG TPA: polysaccharide deacetylase family protein [Polyangiales bacterium]|nr:polysaccharide deacetylase family protein [Polyangiales bacterium]
MVAGVLGWLLTRSAAVADDPLRTKVRIAITFDDLPGSAELPRGYDSERLISELIDALKAHDVKNATGFVIGSRLAVDPSGEEALKLWADAGYEFGNHSYSHRSFADIGNGYFTDLASWEPTMRALEQEADQRLRFFRYPYLQEGRDVVERKLLSSGLTQLGYTLARVSLDFRDWEWADAYNRCLDHNDASSEATLSLSYLEYARANLSWTLATTDALFERPLTHVLLLHANVATARNMDALLTAYERKGAEFVTLGQALADPIYTAEYAGREGTLLQLVSTEQGRPLPPEPPRPSLALTCP